MTREEGHKLLDKLLDTQYCGDCGFMIFMGGIRHVEFRQTVKDSAQLVMVAVG